ncbi:MAG TPA: TolC family protein, partial [Candidatus Dormibacteraeota bacterium]|nr:TolC family protein [Candidatus Dormibacteraeota bacterium]
MKSLSRFAATRGAWAAAALLLLLPGGLLAQQTPARAPASSPLTLSQAVRIALEKNPARKIALADTRAASANVREARSHLLPRVTFSETVTRSNDPVYVFGSKLRQRGFTAADFDLNTLNAPAPFGNFSSRFGGTWTLFDSLSTWRTIHRSERTQDAMQHQLDRTDQEIVFRVVDSYYGVLLARKQLEVAEQALKTAQAILDRSRNRVESGVVVESDALSAQVRLAARKQELIRAQDNLSLSLAQLGTAMGLATENNFDPAEVLAERNFPLIALPEAEKVAVESRPDLKRIRSDEAAQAQSVAIAKSSFGPRVNAFADWEADNPSFVGGGGGNNWLA